MIADDGLLETEVTEVQRGTMPEIKTKITMNIGNPQLAFDFCQLPNAAFWPKPVIVRLSDFKSNEYRKLIGGSLYEPEEENPMLGFRGAARYISTEFGEAFAMECEALKRVRNDMGLTNVEIMVPFVRTLGQAKAVGALGVTQAKPAITASIPCPASACLALAKQDTAFARLPSG